MSPHFENRNHVISILFCLQIENQRRKSENPQRGRGENRAFEARSRALVQDVSGRTRGVAKIVRQRIEKSLHSGRRSEAAQFAQLRWIVSKIALAEYFSDQR